MIQKLKKCFRIDDDPMIIFHGTDRELDPDDFDFDYAIENNDFSKAMYFGLSVKMTESEVNDLSKSTTNLIDAFNDLEAIVDRYGVMTWNDYRMEYPDFARMCSDCIFLYNECEHIIDNFGGHFNREQLDYLRYLRINCAHYCGSTKNNLRYYEAVFYVILPMKESIRSMLHEVIDNNDREDPSDAVKQFNRKKRSSFRFG